MDTTARATAAASALERQRRAYNGASRTASSKHGSSRPERPRLGASVDGEARQETALLMVRPRRGTSLSRPSHAMSSNSVERCRWRRRADSASRRPPNNGTHSTRLEAFTDVPLELRSSRLLPVSSRLLCSNSTVELHCSLDDDFPARNSRADAICSEFSCARTFCGNTIVRSIR